MNNNIEQYITDRFKLVVADLKLTRTDDDKHKCLNELHMLYNIASEKIGFDFADNLIKGIEI